MLSQATRGESCHSSILWVLDEDEDDVDVDMEDNDSDDDDSDNKLDDILDIELVV